MGHQGYILVHTHSKGPVPLAGADVFTTSFTFSNTAGRAHQFVAMFVKGDVPVGTHIVSKIAGVEQPTQCDAISTHTDGSLALCVIRVFLPLAVVGTTFTHSLYKKPGTYSAPTSLSTTADITSHDFKVVASDVRNGLDTVQGSGVYNFSVNTNIAVAARTEKIGTGFCDEWFTRGKATDNTGGAEHAHLYSEHVVRVWRDPANPGSVHAICHSPVVEAGWRNVAGAASYIFTASYKDGASNLISVSGDTHTFVAADMSAANDTIAGGMTALNTGEMVRLTTTGSFSGTGLAAATNYFVRNENGGTVQLFTSSYDAFRFRDDGAIDDPPVDLTGTFSGIGTVTATRYTYLYYHTGQHIRATDGQEEWTANKPTIDPAYTAAERTYISKAGFAYTYDYTKTFSNLTTVNYFPGNPCWPAGNISDSQDNGYIRENMDGPGDHSSLYAWGKAAATAWQTMNATDLRVARILGLCARHLSVVWIDETLVSGHECAKMLTLNNGSDDAGTPYPGMGTPLANTGQLSDFSWGTLGGRSVPLSMTADGSHWPQMTYVAYLLTGDYHILRTMGFCANFPMWCTNTANTVRTKAIGGHTYWGNWPHWIQQRTDGYSDREWLGVAYCFPDTSPEQALGRKILDDGVAYWAAYTAARDASYAADGHWSPVTNSWDGGTNPTNASGYRSNAGFQINWNSMAALQLGRLRPTTNCLAYANHTSLQSKRLSTTVYGAGNAYWSALYYYGVHKTDLSATYMAPADWGEQAGSGTENCSFGASNVVTSPLSGNWENDDQVWFYAQATALPPEITAGNKFFIINKNVSGANTFNISLTQGGSAFPFTATAGNFGACFIFVVPGSISRSTATGYGYANSGYAQMSAAVACLANAWNYSGWGAIVTDHTTRLASISAPLSGDARFNFSPTVL